MIRMFFLRMPLPGCSTNSSACLSSKSLIPNILGRWTAMHGGRQDSAASRGGPACIHIRCMHCLLSHDLIARIRSAGGCWSRQHRTWHIRVSEMPTHGTGSRLRTSHTASRSSTRTAALPAPVQASLFGRTSRAARSYWVFFGNSAGAGLVSPSTGPCTQFAPQTCFWAVACQAVVPPLVHELCALCSRICELRIHTGR